MADLDANRLIDLRLSNRTRDHLLPRLLSVLGLRSIAELLRRICTFDGTLPAREDRIRWDEASRCYVYTPTHLPPQYHYRQILLAYTDHVGWSYTLPDPEINLWLRALSPEDPRNRPDCFPIVAMLVAEAIDNKGWAHVATYLRKLTRLSVFDYCICGRCDTIQPFNYQLVCDECGSRKLTPYDPQE